MPRAATEATGVYRVGLGLTLVPVGWIAGTALQLQQRALSGAWAYGAAIVAALTVLLCLRLAARRPRYFAGLAWLLASLLLAWGATGGRALLYQQQALAPALEGVDLVLTGLVAAMPQRNPSGTRFDFEVESAARPDGERVRVPARVRLGWYSGTRFPQSEAAANARAPQSEAHEGVRAGDRWRFTVRLVAPHGNANPHGFDYELWLWERGIGATGYVRAGPRDPAPALLARHVAHTVERARQSVRDRILALGQGASADAAARAGVVAALVTGDQNAIAQPDWGVFRITGVAHLMAISGLHITMIAWLAALAMGLLWRRAARWQRWLRFNPCLRWPAPHAALVGGLLVALAYATFSGLGVPAQRTVLMLACVTLLRLAGLRWPWWLTWAWACALVLALDPWALTQAGFWLSFVAIGILFITDGRRPERGRKGLKAHVGELLGTQSKVTVALAPLTLILFGQASIVGLLANLAAIPWVTLVVTPTALAGLVWPPLWQVAAWAVVPLMALLRTLAAWPWAQISVAAAPLLWGVAAALGALLLVLRWPWSWRLAGVPLVLPLLLWQPPRPAPGEMDLLAADIGQGSAILLRTARHTLLYDAGPRYSEQGDAGERVLVPLLRALGERPDLLLLSHRDDDHTGGAASIVAAFPATWVLASIPPGRDPEGVAVQRRCVAGDRWVWDGVAFEVLHPSVAAAQSARSSNAMSCVLRVQARSTAVLFTGDLEAAQEKALLASGADVRSDVLLVPHHGSKTSSSAPWIEAVAPRFALIQAGYRNRYGHPAEPVLARYAAARVAVVDTPHCGAIRWDSTRPDRVGCERVDQVRYWTHQPR